jgi:hypothetical protein
MTSKTKPRDITKLPTRQLKDEAEAIVTASSIDGAALAAIDIELRRRKSRPLTVHRERRL